MTVTLDADQGVQAVKAIRPGPIVPIHYDDYDAFASTLDEFMIAMEAEGLDELIQTIERGGTLPIERAVGAASAGRAGVA